CSSDVAALSRRRALERSVAFATACAVLGAVAGNATPAARAASLQGTVAAAGKALASAQVTLFGASRDSAAELGHATTDASGRFMISYGSSPAGVLYVDATPA